jgi:DnaJ-class molecular chaperone
MQDDLAPGDEAPESAQSTGKNICPRCGGKGRVDDAPCPTCAGTGQVNESVGGG